MSEELAALGQRIKTASASIGSQRKAAEAADVCLTQWERYIKGVASPAFLTVARFASAAGVHLDWLAFGKGQMRPSAVDPASTHAATTSAPAVALIADELLTGRKQMRVPGAGCPDGKPTELGRALRQARGDQPIPVAAKRLGVNKNTLGSYERGQATPDLEFLVRFADVLGAPLSDLIDLRLIEAKAPITSANLKHFHTGEAGVRRAATPPPEVTPADDALLREALKSLLARMGG